jgi:hypothetical protein
VRLSKSRSKVEVDSCLYIIHSLPFNIPILLSSSGSIYFSLFCLHRTSPPPRPLYSPLNGTYKDQAITQLSIYPFGNSFIVCSHSKIRRIKSNTTKGKQSTSTRSKWSTQSPWSISYSRSGSIEATRRFCRSLILDSIISHATRRQRCRNQSHQHA